MTDARTPAAPAQPTPAPAPALDGRPQPPGIDPRGPRFGAGVTAALLVAVLVLGTGTAATALLTAIAALFALGVWARPAHPWSVLFRRVVRPRLAPPSELEDPRPPRFAQLVGLAIAGAGAVLGWAGVGAAVPVAAAVALVAAFLNAAFGFCLGCELYLLGLRLRTARTRAA